MQSGTLKILNTDEASRDLWILINQHRECVTYLTRGLELSYRVLDELERWLRFKINAVS